MFELEEPLILWMPLFNIWLDWGQQRWRGLPSVPQGVHGRSKSHFLMFCLLYWIAFLSGFSKKKKKKKKISYFHPHTKTMNPTGDTHKDASWIRDWRSGENATDCHGPGATLSVAAALSKNQRANSSAVHRWTQATRWLLHALTYLLPEKVLTSHRTPPSSAQHATLPSLPVL